MKKLLVTVIGAAAALGASAVDPISTQRFEDAPALGPTDISGLNTLSGGTAYWVAANDATNNTYEIAAAGAVNCPRQTLFSVKPENSLAIKTTFGKPLSLNAVDGGTPTNINSSIYFDSLVKFTVCEDTPDQEYSDAKIVMWLQEQYDENQEITGTNFMVRAGFLYVEGGQVKSSNVVYKCNSLGDESGFDANSWHRVTIKAIANVTKSTSTKVPGFGIYIDGDDSGSSSPIKVQSTAQKWDSTFTSAFAFSDATFDLRDGNALFPSSDQVSANPSVTAVAFDGTGSITDLIFTEEAPSFAEDSEPQIPVATVDTGSGEPETYYTLAEAINAVNAAQSATVTFALAGDLNLEEPIEFFNSTAEITLDFAGFVITNSLAGAAITNRAASLTIVNSTENIGGIYCSDAVQGRTLYAADGLTTIEGGFYRGIVAAAANNKLAISGGYFTQDTGALRAYIPESKELVDSSEMAGFKELANRETHTITFSAAGGQLTGPGSVVIYDGDPVTKPTDPTYVGHEFVGWYWDNDGVEEEFVFADPEEGDPVYPEGNITIYAKWSANTYTITFTYGLDHSSSTSANYAYGETPTAPDVLIAVPGYNASWPEFSTVTEATTYAAVYTPVDYTITFDGNGGTTPNATIFTVTSAAFDLPIPTLADNTFAGWTNETYTTAFTNFNPQTWTGYADFKLYAKWTPLGPVTPTIDPANPEPVEVTAASESDAIDAVAVTPPALSGADAGEYKALFNYEATPKGGDAWEVELVSIKETVVEDVNEDAVASLVAAAADSGATDVSVDVPAGLYYRVTTYNTLGGSVVDFETGLSDGTGTTPVDKPESATQGFIKVEMSTVPFD